MYPGEFGLIDGWLGFAGPGLDPGADYDQLAYADGGYTYWTDFLFQGMFAATGATGSTSQESVQTRAVAVISILRNRPNSGTRIKAIVRAGATAGPQRRSTASTIMAGRRTWLHHESQKTKPATQNLQRLPPPLQLAQEMVPRLGTGPILFGAVSQAAWQDSAVTGRAGHASERSGPHAPARTKIRDYSRTSHGRTHSPP